LLIFRAYFLFFSCFFLVFTYRYFLHQFPDLCILAVSEDDPDGEPIGCVVCKVDEVEGELLTGEGPFEVPKPSLSGYMAMLAVNTTRRRSGIGSALVERVVRRMRKRGCSSVTLETEVSNMAAMRLYEEKLGFIREELLVRYYLNWGDAYRLRLWFD
jgi:peptide alpha-N-acetyltransferase